MADWRARLKRGVAALAVGLTLAGPAAAQTLADAFASGYRNSGLLDQNRALLRAADEDVAQAIAALRPVINWSASTTVRLPRPNPNTPELSNQLAISGELTLYDGGANQYAVEVQKELVLATRASLLSVEQEVLLRVAEAYLEYQRASAFVGLRQNNVRLITQELRAARDRFEVGEVTRTDVSLAEARLAAARSQLAAEEGGLARAFEEYRAAVGARPGALAPATPATLPASLAEARAIALGNHPALDEARHNVTATELNILRARAAMRPSLRLNGQVSTDFEGNEVTQFGLTAGGPIYQGGRLASQVRQFQARRDAARAGLHVTSLTIEQNVGIAWSFVEVARASREATERQVRAATSAFNSVREEATLGARTTLDVLNAEQELLDARASLVSSQVDQTVAGYTLLSAMGLLTAQNLGLDVQIYDPAAYYNLVRDAPAALSEQGRALDRVLQAIGDN